MPFFSLPTGGSPVVAGDGAPTGTLGNVGDLFIDKTNRMLYGPKTISGWPSGPVDLSNGPTGNVGPTGAASTVTGPRGATGPTAPASTLSVGTVATGTTAAVTITGTAPAQSVSFVIPVFVGPTGAASIVTGPVGSIGPTGVLGPTGPSGGPTGPTGLSGPTGPASRGGVNVQTATGTIDLDGNSAKYQFISANDNSYTVKLPTGVDAGFDLFIKENAGIGYSLTIETTTATGVSTLGGYYNPSAAIVVWDGSLWRAINF